MKNKKGFATSRETESNRRPKDDWDLTFHYSPPLYQLSYHGLGW